MDFVHIGLITLGILITVSVIWYLYLVYSIFADSDAYFIASKWNNIIASVVDRQNKVTDEGLPVSMQYADTCNLPTARKLHSLIVKNHSQILSEVNALIKSGYQGFSMGEMDQVQNSGFKSQTGWRPIWVRFYDSWAGTAESLPTLKRIVSKFKKDVFLLHISVFAPGVDLPSHTGVTKGMYRYHYGLSIPQGNLGLFIEGKEYKWRNKEGVIWDDTLVHKAWNKTDQPRLVIFADIARKLPFPYGWVNKKIHNMVAKTKHLREIKTRIENEGVPKEHFLPGENEGVHHPPENLGNVPVSFYSPV